MIYQEIHEALGLCREVDSMTGLDLCVLPEGHAHRHDFVFRGVLFAPLLRYRLHELALLRQRIQDVIAAAGGVQE
jgi:hypothetical protein